MKNRELKETALQAKAVYIDNLVNGFYFTVEEYTALLKSIYDLNGVDHNG